MSDMLRDILVREEGCRLSMYSDSLGFATIGYGHNLARRPIPQSVADLLLDEDISAVKEQVVKYLPWVMNLDEARRAVIYAICYQLGIAGLMNFKNMLAAVQKGDYATAAEEMLNSRWHRQTPDRCERMANLMLHGGQP